MASMLVSKASNIMSSGEEHKRIPTQHLEGPRSVGAAQEVGEAEPLHDVSAKEQRRIYRKVDWRLTPMLILLNFFANLDRFVLKSFVAPDVQVSLMLPRGEPVLEMQKFRDWKLVCT